MDFGVMSIIDSSPRPGIAADDSRGTSVQQAPLELNPSFLLGFSKIHLGAPKTWDGTGDFLGLQVAKPRGFKVLDRGAKGRNVFIGVTSDFSKV